MSDEKEAIAQNISLLMSQNRSAEARVELERLIALDPEDPESRSTAGDVYAWTGADGAAYKQYNLAAEIFNRLGRADKALGVHHKILDLDTSMMDAATQARVRLLTLLVNAEDALVAGQNDKAVAGYKEAIRQFPNHTITYQRLSSLLVRLGRHAEAVEQYLTVGRAFYAHGVLPKARPYFERVLELQADQGEALEAVLTCLKAEDKEPEGLRFLKSAVQAALENGNNEAAAAWFERLPEEEQVGASPLASALLLQSEEVGQAERMVAQLDLARPEISDWYKRLGRAALDRGDSLAADVYFRWSTGQVEAPPVAVAPAPSVVEAPPVLAPLPEPEPVVEVSERVAVLPPMLMAPPLPPPGLAAPTLPPPPPGLAAPSPPPFLAAPAPPAALPPAPVVAAPVEALPPPPESALAPTPEGQDDRAILQTMGEMCLAEDMFEEAKQVFERLTRADPGKASYWELLNRARAGLGLHGVSAPVAPAQPPAPQPALVPPPALAPPLPLAPPVLVAAAPVVVQTPPPALSLPALPVLAAPPAPNIPSLPLFAAAEAAPEAPPEAVVEPAAEAPTYRPELEPMGRRGHASIGAQGGHVERPSVEWGESPFAVGPAGAKVSEPHAAEPVPAPTPSPAPPAPAPVPMLAASAASKTPSQVMREQRATTRTEEKIPALSVVLPDGVKITHTAFAVQLGELPPAVLGTVDLQDEIIE